MSGDNYPITWQQLEFEKLQRDQTIEECAQLVENWRRGDGLGYLAEAIRALKSKAS